MKKVVLLCGSHPRHLYVANELLKHNLLAGMVMELRENFEPVPPTDLSEQDKKNFIFHFKKRSDSENKFFKKIESSVFSDQIPFLEVKLEELNSDKTFDFVDKLKADLMISYGIHKLDNKILSLHNGNNFNIHGGLSPWFKGNTTLFWPFYMLRPNWAGITIHRLTQKLDGGEILHQSLPELESGDSMHDVANKAVIKATEDLIKIIRMYDNGKELLCHEQKGNGKLFLSDDWTPQTLRVIYNLFDDRIVDMFLNGEITSNPPKIIDFFNQN